MVYPNRWRYPMKRMSKGLKMEGNIADRKRKKGTKKTPKFSKKGKRVPFMESNIIDRRGGQGSKP